MAEVIARMEKQGPEMGHGKVTTTWAEGNTSSNVSVEVGDSEADAACKRVLLSLAWAQMGIYDGFKFMKPITKGQVEFESPCPQIA
ncbi:MAG: hypothetical protein ACHP7P_14625 [Terriglobales bacterium]